MRLSAVAATAIAVVIAIGLTPGKAVGALLGFADFWCGVIALLSFTGAVVWGQIAIERRVLTPRHRLWAQAVHRGMGVLGLGSLALHITAKVAYGEASAAAVVPFANPRERFLVGLGALSLYLMLAAAVSGATRSSFVKRRHPRRWRWLHGASYVGWASALVHGLKTGRPVSTPWVTVGYAACLLAVAAVLVWRAARPARRWLETTPMDAPGGGRRRRGRTARGATELERLPATTPVSQAPVEVAAAPESIALPAPPRTYSSPYPEPHQHPYAYAQPVPPQQVAPEQLPPPGHAQDYLQTWPGTSVEPPQPPLHPTLYQDTEEMPLPKPVPMPSAGRPW
ncbi:hypothetical protein ACWD00_21855 [Streptomyces viridiviolaceus]